MENLEYLAEINYDANVLNNEILNNEASLTSVQQRVDENLINSIETDTGKLFFLDAPGGTGKTYHINLLLANVYYCEV